MSTLLGIFVGFGILLVILAPIAIACLVVSGMGHVYVLKELGYPTPVLGYIPFLNTIILGTCMADENGKNKTFGIELPNLVFALYPVIGIICIRLVDGVGSLLNFVVCAIGASVVYGCAYARMEGKTQEECQGMGLASGIIAFIPLIKFWGYRSKGVKPE